jgi:hypothetical protein
MNRTLLVILFISPLALLLGGTQVARAAESYDNCTGFIASVPVVITTQGTWCLKHDLTTGISSGNAITVATNNVTIDCNDFKLGGLAAGVSTQADGIHADNRSNVTVRRCNIRGFLFGMELVGTGGGHVVEDNRFDGNTYAGMQIHGDGSVVRRNRVFDTGGSSSNGSAYGMVTNNSVDILDNTVSGVVGASGFNGTTVGISVANNVGGSISGNKTRSVLKSGTGIAYGIQNVSDSRVTLRENDVVGDASVGSIGLHCDSTTSRALNNVIGGTITGLDGCSDDGGNVIAP